MSDKRPGHTGGSHMLKLRTHAHTHTHNTDTTDTLPYSSSQREQNLCNYVGIL